MAFLLRINILMHTSALLEKQDLFKIKSIDGFSPQIGHLLSLMNYARITTFDMTEGLSISDLDFLLDEKANSIGMLLSHIASVEWVYYVSTIEIRKPTELEMEYWSPSLDLGDLGRKTIKGNPVEFYIERLESVREKTLSALSKLDDTWLYEESDFWDNKITNNYFKWFHVLEDEINHRGQIRMIKKRIS